MTWLSLLAATSLALWLYLLLARDGFWRARPRIEDAAPPAPASWPAVVAIVPARNEAKHVEEALGSLLVQDYPGELVVVLVDDHSDDETAAIARRLAANRARPLEVIAARALPPGWSGKLWAVAEGLRHGAQARPPAVHLLLTDADIAHPPDSIARLVAKAEAERLDLVSLMVRLHCGAFWERLLIPPFVFFFQKLYPFAAVNDPGRSIAAAAGGCMLVRRRALEEAGGIAAIRGELIDDIALARAIKHRPGGGRIWLGLSATTKSLRAYDRLAGIWAMVVRSADTELRHSLARLAATLLGMGVAYLIPPFGAIAGIARGDRWLAALALAAWAAMAIAYRPTARLYRLGAPRLLFLPLAAALYVAMTVDSAIRHRRGTGGRWKGRVFSPQ
jgi:hopene-associated glycosyltransferase HpnB